MRFTGTIWKIAADSLLQSFLQRRRHLVMSPRKRSPERRRAVVRLRERVGAGRKQKCDGLEGSGGGGAGEGSYSSFTLRVHPRSLLEGYSHHRRVSASGEERGVAILGLGLGLEKCANCPRAVFPRGNHDRGLSGVVEAGRFDGRVGARFQKAHQDIEAAMPQGGHEGSLVEVGVEPVHVRSLGDEAPDGVLVSSSNGFVQPILEARLRASRTKESGDLGSAGSLGDGEGGDAELITMGNVGAALDEESDRLRVRLCRGEERRLTLAVGKVGVGARGEESADDLDAVPGAEKESGLSVRVPQVGVGSGGEKRLDRILVSLQGGEHERGRAFLVPGVDFRSRGQERLHALLVARSSGKDQLLARKNNDPREWTHHGGSIDQALPAALQLS